jgi:hypothetical protein
MKVTSTAAKEFELNDDIGRFLGKLEYENWISTKASITTQFAEFYDIKSKGFWSAYIAVEKAGAEYAQLKRNWKGNVIIDILGNDQPMDYLFRRVGFWQERFQIEDHNKNILMTLTPDFKWGKLNYDYNIDINPQFTDTVDEMMMLLSIFCANYLRKKRAAKAG